MSYDFALDFVRDQTRAGATKFYAGEVAKALGIPRLEAHRRLLACMELGAVWVSFRSADEQISYNFGDRVSDAVDHNKLYVTYAPVESFAHKWWLRKERS